MKSFKHSSHLFYLWFMMLWVITNLISSYKVTSLTNVPIIIGWKMDNNIDITLIRLLFSSSHVNEIKCIENANNKLNYLYLGRSFLPLPSEKYETSRLWIKFLSFFLPSAFSSSSSIYTTRISSKTKHFQPAIS